MEGIRGVMSFVAVAEQGSFAAAGRALGISAVAVSKNVARLEAQLGVRLFQRTTRQLALTGEGTQFLSDCAPPLRELASAHQRVRASGSDAAGVVRVTAISSLVREYIAPALGEFYRRHPRVTLQMTLSETVADMVGERFDVGLRVGALEDASFVARRLGPMRFPICAAPSLLARHGVPSTLDALALMPALLLQRGPDEPPASWWMASAKGRVNLQPRPVLVCNDLQALLAACLGGAGLAQLPLPLALPSLRAGALRTVMPGSADDSLSLFVHYPSRRQLPPRVRAFVDFAIEKLDRHPDFEAPLSVMSPSDHHASAG